MSKRKVWAVNVLCLAGCGGEIGDEEDTWEEGAALDRVFAAHDDTTGKELWRARLGDVPSKAPISYLANGKQ